MNSSEILEELTTEIESAQLQHRINPDTMFLVRARDEILRLNTALIECRQKQEELFSWLNEVSGERVQIIRPLRAL